MFEMKFIVFEKVEYNFPISFISYDILKITLKNEFNDILLNFQTKRKYEYE